MEESEPLHSNPQLAYPFPQTTEGRKKGKKNELLWGVEKKGAYTFFNTVSIPKMLSTAVGHRYATYHQLKKSYN